MGDHKGNTPSHSDLGAKVMFSMKRSPLAYHRYPIPGLKGDVFTTRVVFEI